MALQMGIVGLPNVGKSTMLNALTHAHAEASNYPFCTIDKNVGVATVEDPRLARLAELLTPRESIPAAIRFVDIANVAEDDPGGCAPAVARLRSGLRGESFLPLAVSLEEEIARLDPEERAGMLADLGLPGRGIDRLLDLSRALLRLITFYTTANEKLQAWLIPEGMKAPAAAGRIHTDMERGFIRMEVFRLEDVEELRTRAELHRHGRIRVEGKEYVLKDGDICHILFHPS